eukprot:gnl/TRDRNA2_/TRDRNA2_166024_c6_seq2.p1 gnl/TRDRNA2_/TRDRNA2_166024_c6~~gnl/TRDRNA2_/TRDRNA2_166024_c6_seq2.p1  ORF type:complete len:389 (+),score=58.72 gnl/TRDRNA2_/TRDRNA2_166024_c6_seq2:72-1238(+)
MAPESHKDLHGPSRAYWHYLEHAATQAARAEAAIAALDGQFLTMERQCALPRRPGLSKAKRRASSTAAVLPADSVQDAVEDFADKNPLKKIRVSPRYGKVNGRLLGLHVPVGGQKKKNLEMQGEVANNKFKMVEYRKTMQRPCFAAREQRPLRTCALVAWDQRQRRAVEYTKPDGTRKTLRVELWGPEEALELWSRWCAWCEANVFNMQKVAGLGKPPAHPYPVMIPTKGRAKDAHLNWSAPHVFGDVGVPPACGTAAADDAKAAAPFAKSRPDTGGAVTPRPDSSRAAWTASPEEADLMRRWQQVRSGDAGPLASSPGDRGVGTPVSARGSPPHATTAGERQLSLWSRRNRTSHDLVDQHIRWLRGLQQDVGGRSSRPATARARSCR